MAIVINSNPGIYYSAHGDLIFVVYESVKANDPVTYPDYKYVADIYIGATLIARIKKVPQPGNKRGVFNIGQIIRNYVSAAFGPNPIQLQAQELGLAGFFIGATVKFGEDYGFTTYTNLTIDSERFYFNHYNGRLLGQNTNLTPFLGKVATIRPYETAVNINDNFTLIPYLPDNTDPIPIVVTKYGAAVPGTPVTIEWGYFPTDPYATVDTETMQFNISLISGYNAFNLNYTGSATSKYLVLKEPVSQPVKTKWQNTIYNYGTMPDSVFRAPVEISGFRYYVSRIPVVLDSTDFRILFSNASPVIISPVLSVTFTVTVDPSSSGTTPFLQILNVAPQLINVLTPGFIDDNVSYYTVQFGASSVLRFDLACEPRYEIHRVHFLNRFGGFETKNFTKVSRTKIEIIKSDFGKLPYTIDSAGNVNYYNSFNVYNEQKATYASQYTEALTLNSDITTDDEYTWLADLVLSPLVYLEDDGYFLPVTIAATNYEFKKQVNDKLTNLTIDLNFSEQFNTQYR